MPFNTVLSSFQQLRRVHMARLTTRLTRLQPRAPDFLGASFSLAFARLMRS